MPTCMRREHCRRGLVAFEFDVAGGAGVVGDSAAEAQVGGGAGRGVDAHVAHCAADREVVDARAAEFFEERRLAEAVGEVFYDDRLARPRGD